MTTIEIGRESFLHALAAVEPAVPKKSPKEILQNVHVRYNDDGIVTLTATDQEIAVRYEVAATVAGRGEFLIPAGRLRSILSEVNGSTVSLDLSGDALTIAAGFAEFTIPTADAAEFPAFPENVSPDSITLKAAALSLAIRRTIWATDPENSRYALGGVKLSFEDGKAEFAATDSRRCSVARVAVQTGGDPGNYLNTVIPAKSMAIAERLVSSNAEQDVEILIQPSSVLFKIGSQRVFSRLVEGRFPRYQDIVPDDKNPRFREAIMAGPWNAAIRQSQITTNEDSRGVDFVFKPGKLTLKSQANDVGSAKIELPLEGSGTDFTVTLDPRFVGDMLKCLSPETVVSVLMNDAESAILLQVDDGAFRYVVMPLSRDR
jgi:DNA polymerase-3 subunit beta